MNHEFYFAKICSCLHIWFYFNAWWFIYINRIQRSPILQIKQDFLQFVRKNAQWNTLISKNILIVALFYACSSQKTRGFSSTLTPLLCAHNQKHKLIAQIILWRVSTKFNPMFWKSSINWSMTQLKPLNNKLSDGFDIRNGIAIQ